MEERKFKIGDVVKLCSDTEENCPMTVNAYYLDTIQDNIFVKDILTERQKHSVKCVWRDKEDKPHSEFYSEDSLCLVEGK